MTALGTDDQHLKFACSFRNGLCTAAHFAVSEAMGVRFQLNRSRLSVPETVSSAVRHGQQAAPVVNTPMTD